MSVAMPVAPNLVEEIFSCQDCGKTFNDAHKLKRHNKVHGDKIFVCEQEVCGKRFLDKSKLKRHQLVHTKDRPFVCEHPGCDKRFSLAYNRTIHMRIHSGHKPFVCDIKGCTAAFAQASNLKSHRRTHDRRKLFHCDFPGCGEEFSKRASLKIHSKLHVPGGESAGPLPLPTGYSDYPSPAGMEKAYNGNLGSVPQLSLSAISSNPHLLGQPHLQHPLLPTHPHAHPHPHPHAHAHALAHQHQHQHQHQHAQHHSQMGGMVGVVGPMSGAMVMSGGAVPSSAQVHVDRNGSAGMMVMPMEAFRMAIKQEDSLAHYAQQMDCKVCGLEFNHQMQLSEHMHASHGITHAHEHVDPNHGLNPGHDNDDHDL